METFASTAFIIVIFGVMLLGLFGLLTTIIPGLTVIWAAGLAYGLVTGFDTTGWIIFGVMTALMLFGNIVDNLLMGAGARAKGASWLSIGVALVAGIAGTILYPPFGGVIFAIIGLFTVEIIRSKDWRSALESSKSLIAGLGKAVLARFGIGIVMIGLWIAWVVLAG